ncbi:ashwin isoform 2 [Corchorus capsularis]|uniref:Ashwin isoform 2 n=1 Tax=Corchorus capsularis TaxID=210143 RepID=A0A1R3G059_COCAP|nr:ashwin isoform 2 [Corchorus capsularis]
MKMKEKEKKRKRVKNTKRYNNVDSVRKQPYLGFDFHGGFPNLGPSPPSYSGRL